MSSTAADWVGPLLVAVLGTSGVTGVVKFFQNRPSKGAALADAADKTVSTMTRAMEVLEKRAQSAEAARASAEDALHQFQVRYGESAENDQRAQTELRDLRRQLDLCQRALAEARDKLTAVRAQLAQHQKEKP